MNTPIGIVVLTLVGLGGSVFEPSHGSAQSPIRMPQRVEPLERNPTPRQRILMLEASLESEGESYDVRCALAREYATLAAFETDERNAGKELARRARNHALLAKELQPDRTEGRYWLAVASGFLASVESGRAILGFADEAWVESGWILARDAMHGGAHYIRGRLHAAIMRQSSFRRFLARTLFDTEAVEEASWELAEHHLARAAELEPELPMHHFELAAVLRDIDEPERMTAALRRAVETTGSSVLDERYRERAMELLGSVGSPPPSSK
jgi:hypothetical protein